MNLIILAIISILLPIITLAKEEIPSSPTVIYGEDNRKEIYTLNPILQKLALSTFIITQKKRVIKQPNGHVLSYLHYGRAFKLCLDERFYDQLSSGFCSGFLIGGDLAVTAGHCISENTCNFVNLVFDYQLSAEGNLPSVFSQDKIYSCKEVLFSEKTELQDYTIFRLDRNTNRAGLTLSQNHSGPSDLVSLLGYPSGLPAKYSAGGIVRHSGQATFKASLDSYGGSSGSPVFDTITNEVVGILTGGEDDFISLPDRQCFISNRCAQDSCSGEDVTHISYVRHFLNHL